MISTEAELLNMEENSQTTKTGDDECKRGRGCFKHHAHADGAAYSSRLNLSWLQSCLKIDPLHGCMRGVASIVGGAFDLAAPLTLFHPEGGKAGS